VFCQLEVDVLRIPVVLERVVQCFTRASSLPFTPVTSYTKPSEYMHGTEFTAAPYQQQQTPTVGVRDEAREGGYFLVTTQRQRTLHMQTRTHTHTQTHLFS